VIGGLISAVTYSIITFVSPWQFLFLITLPVFVINVMAVRRKASRELDPYLKQMALSTLLFVVLFGVGLLLASV
jgi:1,4-dihydroxy-2-naphthoate polyprenyltransferase